MKNVSAEKTEYFSPNPKYLLMRESGVSFSLSGLLPQIAVLILSMFLVPIFGEQYTDTNWGKYLTYLIPQLCFCATICIFFVRTKAPVREVVGKCKWQYYLIALLLQFGLIALSEINGYFLRFLEKFGYQSSDLNLPDLSGWNVLPAIFVIALLPAVFEEVIFRGMITGSMRRCGWGLLPSVFICGALFSLAHGRPEQTIYQFICGTCFALIAWRSGSVLPTVISHFLNNALILILTGRGVSNFPLAVQICSAICFVGVLIYLIFFDKNNAQKGKPVYAKIFFLCAAVGIFLSAFSWVASLILGF